MDPQLKTVLNSVAPFSEEEFSLIEPFIETVSLQKNQVLLAEGQSCSHVYLVAAGCLRNYYNRDGTDVNLSFTFENGFTTNFEAYLNREPSKIIIQAITKSTVWSINTRAMRGANPENATIATCIRRLAIRMLFATEEHHNMMMMHAPADRYRYLLKNKPGLIQKIPLTHLASYIGVTRETLSRIRSNKY